MTRIIVLHSQDNEEYKQRIERHLKVLKSYGIQFWNDCDPLPDFTNIDIVILMMSSYLISSDIFQDRLMNKLAELPQSRIFPIKLEPCSVKAITWLENIPIIPGEGLSLSELPENQVEKAIATLVDRVTSYLMDEPTEQKDIKRTDRRQILTNTHHFVKFRTGNFVYVDKTRHVYNLLQDEMTHCFLSRPRRFGKSLFLSMVKELFLGNKELFKGLYIYDKYDFKPYPVIHSFDIYEAGI